MKNNIRFDLSDYLIHFFRDVDMEGKNPINMPEHMGWHSLSQGTFFPAIFMLRAALRNGRLWATWSFRNGVRTIYGPNPAICFSDMPIAAFVEASRARYARGEAMAEAALVFPKKEMRAQGARTAIYGLSIEPSNWPSGEGGGPRVFSTEILPLHEQYRFVTDVNSIDWSHEREWRWPCRASTFAMDGDTASDWFRIPGLDFYKSVIPGIGAIVKTRAHADLVIQDMLAMMDAKVAPVSAFSFVLPTEELPSIEGIRDPVDLQNALAEASIDIDQFYGGKSERCIEVNRQFSDAMRSIEEIFPMTEGGEYGVCWLWIHDGSSELARMLLRNGRLNVTKEGRYLARLDEFNSSRSLAQRQEMTRRLSVVIKEIFGVSCGYFSMVGSYDPDNEMAFIYAQEHNHCMPFYNNTWCYK